MKFQLSNNTRISLSNYHIRTMKILLLSPHFDGHYLSIEKLNTIINHHLPFITTQVIKLDNSKNTSADPMLFTLQNAINDTSELLNSVDFDGVNFGVNFGVDFDDVGLIIYDFFAIAGLMIGKLKNIPTICSIPAIMSDNFTVKNEYYDECYQKYLSYINKTGLPLLPDLVSDGFLYASTDNIVWNYQGLYDKLPVKADTNFYFVGSKSQFDKSNLEGNNKKNTVYMSLGTVVPNSLYNIVGVNNEKLQNYILDVYNQVIEFFGNYVLDYNLVVSSAGLPIIGGLEAFDMKHHYANVKVVKYCDQLTILSEAVLFITHGGGNSVNEAILMNCPMLVIPFFGDQYVSARYVQSKQIGDSLFPVVLTQETDFGHSTNEIINNLDQLISYNKIIPDKIDDMMNNLAKYTNSINMVKRYDEKKINLDNILKCICKNICFTSLWKPYDLLFGTTIDRKAFVNYWKCEHLFKIGQVDHDNKYVTVDKLNIVPVLIDQWNDLLRQYTFEKLEGMSVLDEIKQTALDYRTYLLDSGFTCDLLNVDDNGKQIIDMCCHGLDYFLTRGSTVHFVIDTFDKKINVGTYQELQYIMDHDNNQKVIFWIKNGSEYKMVSVNDVKRMDNLEINVGKVIGVANCGYDRLYGLIQMVVGKYNAFLQGRVKTIDSIMHKLESKLLDLEMLDDVIGFRIIYPWVVTLYDIADALEGVKELNLFKRRLAEQNKVIYLFGYVDGSKQMMYEIQLWPTIIYHCFEKEHDDVYKGMGVTSESIQKSLELRRDEHVLQDIVDSMKLI